MKNKLIVISAIWCPSCLILKKHLKKIKQDYPDIEIETFDYDLDEIEIEKYRVGDKLPVLITNNNRLIGEKNYDEIIEFLKESEVI